LLNQTIVMKLIFLFLISFLVLKTQAQTTVTGKVTDNKNHALAGVSVSIKDSYDGGTTDANGVYSFSADETGGQTIVATSVGFMEKDLPVTLSGGTQTVNVSLSSNITSLDAVTITAGAIEASNDRKNTVLKPLDIVTTAGSAGDITGALKTLPGTQQVGNQTGLFVLGGTAEETQTFIDGLRVEDPYFSSLPDIAARGRFSPFLFKGTIFTTGGYSALYGQGLSAALILETEDFPDRCSANVSVSPIGVGAGIDELSKSKKFSWGIDANVTDLALYFDVFKPVFTYTPIPLYYTVEGNFRVKTSKTGLLKFYGYENYGQVGVREINLNHANAYNLFQLKNENVYTNLSFKQMLNEKLKLDAGLSYTYNVDNIKTDTLVNDSSTFPMAIKPVTQVAEGRAVLTQFIGTLSDIKLGADYEYDNLQYSSQYFSTTLTDNYAALFAESDIYFTPKIVARLGLRAEHSSILDKSNIAPRISLAYKPGMFGQFSAAYGDFYEKPPLVFWFLKDSLKFARAQHFIANYQFIRGSYIFRLEAFYKNYYDLVKTVPDTNSSGTGYAKGIEVFWRDNGQTVKNLDYWISYTYLDTKRNWLNYPYAVQPDFAATHTASIVVKEYVPKISSSLGVTYEFATGLPYYNPNDAANAFMSGRTPDYSSLNFNWDYITKVGKAFTVFVLSVSNVLNTNNIYAYNFSSNGQSQSAVTSPLNRFIYVGMFMSFGINRNQDVINNN
jgi:vitamin B12 transporter